MNGLRGNFSNTTKYNLKIITGIILLIYFIFTLTILPAADDWTLAAAPVMDDGKFNLLLPNRIFWRPFEGMLAYFLGQVPSCFPKLNHCLVMLAHMFLCICLYRVLFKITQNTLATFSGLMFFMLSPGIIATVMSIDAINQSWTLLFGVIACWCFNYASIFNKKKFYILYFLAAVIAVLFKENGIVWFLAPVLLAIVKEYSQTDYDLNILFYEHYKALIFGGLGCVLYFIVRFCLMGTVALGANSGSYVIKFSAFNVLKNLAIILGGSLTTIDTLSLFLLPRNLIIVGITLLVSLSLMVWMIKSLLSFYAHKRKFITILLLVVINIFISLPHIFMGTVGEMHAYQMVFGFALILGLLIHYQEQNLKTLKLVFIPLFICMILVSGHKIYAMYHYGLVTHNYLVTHEKYFKNTPKNVLVYYINDCEDGYSVFAQPMGEGLDYGRAFRSQWNWLDSHKFTIKRINLGQENMINKQFDESKDTIFVLYKSGDLKVLKN